MRTACRWARVLRPHAYHVQQSLLRPWCAPSSSRFLSAATGDKQSLVPQRKEKEQPPPPSMADGLFSADSRLLFWVEKPVYFMGLSALSAMQLGYWTWFQYMEAYHPIQQTAETAAMAVTNPLWGQVGFLSGAMFVALVRFFSGNYLRRVALSPERTHLEYTTHTMLGGESRKLQRVALSALSTLPKGKQFYSISVTGKKTFLLLDQAGHFVDEPALLAALNIGGETSGGAAEAVGSEDKAAAAAANARLKLEQLAASAAVQADLSHSYTQHTSSSKKASASARPASSKRKRKRSKRSK